MTCSIGNTQFNVQKNKADLEQKFAQAFKNSMTGDVAEYNNQGTISYFNKTEDGGYIKDTRDDKDTGSISAYFDSTGYIDSIQYKCSDCGDSEVYSYLNEDIDNDGDIDSLLSDYTFIEKDGNKTSTHYEYDSNGNVTDKTTVVRDSENYRLSQTTYYKSSDILSKQEEFYQNGHTKTSTSYAKNSYTKDYFDENGVKTRQDSYDIENKILTSTLLDKNEQPYLFTKKHESSGVVEYGMYKNGEMVNITEKQYNFELEYADKNFLERTYHKIFG